MNHYRKRDPNHGKTRKLRNRVDRGGAIANQEGDDAGSTDESLTAAAAEMREFAQRSRREREMRLHGTRRNTGDN